MPTRGRAPILMSEEMICLLLKWLMALPQSLLPGLGSLLLSHNQWRQRTQSKQETEQNYHYCTLHEPLQFSGLPLTVDSGTRSCTTRGRTISPEDESVSEYQHAKTASWAVHCTYCTYLQYSGHLSPTDSTQQACAQNSSQELANVSLASCK